MHRTAVDLARLTRCSSPKFIFCFHCVFQSNAFLLIDSLAATGNLSSADRCFDVLVSLSVKVSHATFFIARDMIWSVHANFFVIGNEE